MTFILKNVTDVLFYLSFAFFIIIIADLPLFILWILPAAYVIWNLINIRRFTGVFRYESIFWLFLKTFIPFAIICLIFARQSFELYSLPFAVAFLLSAVVLMRTARQSPDVQQDIRFKAMALIPVLLAGIAGLIVASRQVLGIFGWIIYTIYFGIIAPLLMLIINVLVFIITFLSRFISFNFLDRIDGQMGEIPPMEMGIPPQEDIVLTESAYNIGQYLNMFLAALAIATVIFLLVKLFKKLNVQQLAPRASIPQHSFTSPIIKAKKRAPIGSFRKQYLKFLQLMWRQGVAKQPNLTSADYARLSEMGADAEQLRDIYIQVRYNEKPASKADVSFVKELYRRRKIMK